MEFSRKERGKYVPDPALETKGPRDNWALEIIGS
jgi:hypothetical protein